MEIKFGFLCFNIGEDVTINGYPFVAIQIEGENKDSHLGNKMVRSSEEGKLKYHSHEIENDRLVIYQKSSLISVKSVFKKYSDTNAVSVYNEVTNISEDNLTIEYASSFVIYGIADGIEETENTYLYRFTQSHHGECQPRKFNLFDLGLFDANPISQKRISGNNIGSWSTKEELPQGIIEYNDNCLMFQIESNNSWYWEISDYEKKLYLYLGGATSQFGSFEKELRPQETYKTVSVALCQGKGLNDVIGEITKYRRHIKGRRKVDDGLPAIFNEYMHLSWDSPDEENTKKTARIVAGTGVEYYVIDCGWHNEEPGFEVYPYVGQWRESKTRFPHGIRATTEYIRSLGMKAGLWIEPEIIGCKCEEMLGYYDDDCFITRRGKRVTTMGRYFLDYRNQKVIDYMSETIRRMVEDYGADYIKTDYNQDLGVGTDKDSDSYGDGLEQCAKAYLSWMDDMRRTYPNVLFETCSSGGMRMDYETLKHFSIISTSDQTDYRKYPYIAGNILSAVLPEQAAVWSYPVAVGTEPNTKIAITKEWVEENISKEQVIMNMINSFLGRMHLASDLSELSDEKYALIKESVDYYKKLSVIKVRSLPFFPIGFTNFSKKFVCAGLKTSFGQEKIHLAVWNMKGEREKSVFIGNRFKNIVCSYPEKQSEVAFTLEDGLLKLRFSEDYQARFFEIY